MNWEFQILTSAFAASFLAFTAPAGAKPNPKPDEAESFINRNKQKKA